MSYYLIMIPLGIVAGVCAYLAHRGWLMVSAVVAGLFPLLSIWLIYALMKIIFLVTCGNYPRPEWL
ncbi:MAG: hypothetical protein GX898_09935 [Corynebacterium sp.]|nr:hypothetical protein [Corynebacterium sp.]